MDWTSKQNVVYTFNKRLFILALTGVAQWIECWPANQRVLSLIPSQGTCLGCGPHPQLRLHKRQPHNDVSLPLFVPLFPLFKNKYINLFKERLFRLYMEGNSDTCYNMDKPWEHYAKWNKFEISCKHKYSTLGSSHIYGLKRKWWLPEARGRRTGMLFNCYRVSLLQDEEFWVLAAWRCRCI